MICSNFVHVGTNGGRVTVYQVKVTGESLKQTIIGPVFNSSFGQSVALSQGGLYAAVGAPTAPANGMSLLFTLSLPER
jgi:hypothetical protein